MPSQAVAAVEAAGAAAGGGSIWWVSVDQIDASAGVFENNITSEL